MTSLQYAVYPVALGSAIDHWMPEMLNTVLGTFFGALLGIPAGFFINHLWSMFVDRKRRTQLLVALKRTVEHNCNLVDQIQESLRGNNCPYTNVDLTLLESTASHKYELLDAQLCQEIDELRYELGRLERKLDLLLDLEFHPSAKLAITSSAGSHYCEMRPALVESTKVNLQRIRERLNQLNSKH